MTDMPPTRDLILDCAQSLIERGGYHGFSYADIATRVGIRKASIHYHFPAKADLVRVLVERYRNDAEASAAALAASGMGPLGQLRGFCGFWAQCIRDDSRPYCVCAMLASELPVLPPEVATEVRQYFTLLSAWLAAELQAGQASGELRLAQPPAVEAEMFMAMVHGAMLSARVRGDAGVFELVTEGWLSGLASRG